MNDEIPAWCFIFTAAFPMTFALLAGWMLQTLLDDREKRLERRERQRRILSRLIDLS